LSEYRVVNEIIIIIIIIIIISRHHLGPDRPASTSSNNLTKGLPSRLRPFGLQFSITFAILLLFILVACRHFSFSSTGSTLNSSKISSFLCGQQGFTRLFF
jgi:hypothetical protein